MKAFTLAETLITLGIIGIVAALTLPGIINNVNFIRYSSQYKKTLSAVNQAVTLSHAREDVQFSDIKAKCTNNPTSDTASKDRTICGIFNDTIASAKYVENPFNQIIRNGSKYSISEGFTGGNSIEAGTTGWHAYKLADGSMFIFKELDQECTKTSKCPAYLDVNGYNNPNKEISGVTRINYNFLIPSVYAQDTVQDDEFFKDDSTVNSVPYNAAHLTDVYPVYYYDSRVVPATTAGKLVLTNSK